MAVRFDHLALPVRDLRASAEFLGSLLGVPVETEGAEGEFLCLRLGGGAQVLLSQAERFDSYHMAFRVDEAEFGPILERLRARKIPFGNDPEAPTNGESSDPLGGHGRVYFADPNGHLLEVCA